MNHCSSEPENRFRLAWETRAQMSKYVYSESFPNSKFKKKGGEKFDSPSISCTAKIFFSSLWQFLRRLWIILVKKPTNAFTAVARSEFCGSNTCGDPQQLVPQSHFKSERSRPKIWRITRCTQAYSWTAYNVPKDFRAYRGASGMWYSFASLLYSKVKCTFTPEMKYFVTFLSFVLVA